ncbi:MAG: cytochrome c [Sphingomonas sp.]
MRILKRIAIGLVGVVLLGLAVLYCGSEWALARDHQVPLASLSVPHDAASIAEGGRLARITGCRGCHGADGGGTVLVDDPMLGRLVPPALARVAATESDAELDRTIRHGVGKNGQALFVMPTTAHRYLADEDSARIIAWIRSLEPRPDDVLATTGFGPVGRGLILSGMLPPSVHPEKVSSPARPADVGRYFTNVSCAGCHDLHAPRPTEDGKQVAPPLAPMAAAYDPPAFRTLLRTGVGVSGRDLGLMKEVARGDLSALTDAEIVLIQAYLIAEAAKAPPH